MKMKNITAVCVLILTGSGALYAQDAIDKYFTQYANDPSFTSIVISSKMFELFAKMDNGDPENKQVKEAIGGLKGIRILASEEGVTNTKANYLQAIGKVGKEYEVLMSIDDKDEKVRFFILEDGDIIKELLMIVGGKGNIFLMSLVGDIDLTKVASLSKSMNLGGMNYLENLNENEKGK